MFDQYIDAAGPVSIPDAFTISQWSLTDNPSAGGDTLTINIIELPFNGNSPITLLQYRLNGGAAIDLVGVVTGARDITVPATTLAQIEIRAVNAIGNGAWSDLKSATPTVEAAGDPPVLVQVSYVGDDLEMTIDIDGTGYWKWSASATPLSGAAIKAAPDGTEAWFGPGTVLETIADPGPGTWYLNLVAENAFGFSNVITITEVVTGQTFTETWSSYAVGNTFTEVDAAYTRNSTGCTVLIETDADGPDGKRCVISSGSAAERYLYRDDIATALAARTTERVQILAKVRLVSLANARASIGFLAAGNLNTGVRFGGNNATNTGTIGVQLAGDVSSGSNRTDMVTTESSNDLFYIRIEIDGLDVKSRVWEPPASEGGTWTTLTAGAAIDIDRVDLLARVSGACLSVLGYSVGIDADAPSF
jgi:hypothetical protein